MKYFSKETPGKVFSLLSSRIGLLVVIAILIMLFLKQCNERAAIEAEAKREHNNYLAAQDSVRTISKDKDHLIQEKSAFQLKVSELSKDQKDLVAQLGLKSNGRGNTPRTVIETVVEYRDTGRVVSSVIKDASGESINFEYAPEMKGKNKLVISGKTPYKVNLFKDPEDSTRYLTSVDPGHTDLTIAQNIELVTGIYQDPKSKRIMTRVSTTFPNLTFSDVNSFDITDNPETRKSLKNARKEFGIGFTIGYGMALSTTGVKPGLILGVGFHYTPKFLQFGK